MLFRDGINVKVGKHPMIIIYVFNFLTYTYAFSNIFKELSIINNVFICLKKETNFSSKALKMKQNFTGISISHLLFLIYKLNEVLISGV